MNMDEKKITRLIPRDKPGTGRYLKKFHETRFGVIYVGDSRLLFDRHVDNESIDLIITSPPFGLVRKKDMEMLMHMNI